MNPEAINPNAFNNPPRAESPAIAVSAERNGVSVEHIKGLVSGQMGGNALRAAMAENANTEGSMLEQKIRDPQRSEAYRAAEGFTDQANAIIDSDMDARAAAARLVVEREASGVEQLANGDYALRHNGTTHQVNASGIPTQSR